MELLSSCQEAYKKAMQAYFDNANMESRVEEYMIEETTRLMSKLPDKVLDSPVFRVLGVGSGDGHADIPLLTAVAKNLRQENAKIFACIVEPDKTLISKFQSSVSPLPKCLANLAQVSFQWRESTFERYLESSPDNERFHLAHFIFSVYYMDAEQSLKSCYQRLIEGGVILCITATDTSSFRLLYRRFGDELKYDSTQQTIYTDREIREMVVRNGWKYEELSRGEYLVDISSCFDDSSQEGSFLLDFLTHRVNFRKTADEKLRKAVMEFLIEISVGEKAKRSLYMQFSGVVIFKST